MSVASLLVGACLLLPTWSAFMGSLPQPKRRVAIPRAGVWASTQEAQALEKVVRWVQNQVPPDQSILAIPYEPMYYFLTERRNPTHWNFLWPGDQSPEDHRELIRQAKLDPPGAVLLTDREWVRRFAPQIVKYVDAHFTPTVRYGSTVIYLPKGEGKKGVGKTDAGPHWPETPQK